MRPRRIDAGADAFVCFLKNEDNLADVSTEQEGMFKRDELRMLYNEKFRKTRDAIKFSDLKYRDVVKNLRDRKVVFELGDYYSFAKDIQVLYETLSTSEDFQKILDKWKERAETEPWFCGICGVACGTEKSYERHCLGNRHRIHTLQSNIYLKGDQLTSSPSGVVVFSNPAAIEGRIVKEVAAGASTHMTITIENQLKDNEILIFRRMVLLWDTGMFRFSDKNGYTLRRDYHIRPKDVTLRKSQNSDSYEILVACSAPKGYGEHFVPVALYFARKSKAGKLKDGWEQDFVLRFLTLHVIGDMHEELKPVAPFQFPQRIPDFRVKQTIEGEKIQKLKKNALTGGKKLQPARVPKQIREYFDLEQRGGNSQKLRSALGVEMNVDVYEEKMKTLLWVEELQMEIDIRHYDLVNIEMDMQANLLILEVPGLAERRPSLQKCDTVYIYIHGELDIRYKGVVHQIEETRVRLGVNRRLRERWIRNLRFDIRFDFSRTNLWVQHRALDVLEKVRSVLFPSSSAAALPSSSGGTSGGSVSIEDGMGSLSIGDPSQLLVITKATGAIPKQIKTENNLAPTNQPKPVLIVPAVEGEVLYRREDANSPQLNEQSPSPSNRDSVDKLAPWQPVLVRSWYDNNLNEEQRMAVTNIVQGTSRPAPYLLFGPPGTGKTVTVTEAVRQVYHGFPGARILICCPENTAADLLMLKLISKSLRGTVQLRDIYRLYAVYRPIQTVPTEVKETKQWNFDDETQDFFYPSKTRLQEHKILIVTLSNSGRLVSAGYPLNYFTHIFIDEGAHAIEPEVTVPVAGFMDATDPKRCPQLAIAGDPKQLGPVLRSSFSLEYGLDVSIMERLMKDIANYQRCNDTGYNVHYITKLVRNYRSHDSILYIPRMLFYDDELKACGDEMLLKSMLDWEHLPNKKFPLVFHSVLGTDEREADSPSWFNRDEIAQLDKYLQLLLKEKKKGLKIKQKDIGIITPYRKQVQKIREMIRKKKYNEVKGDITVGSVEEFQGQEFKVIIISTVRSNKSIAYKEIDMKFKLGFLKNPKRFNVAITRARALLIVIGNPLTLERDDHWKAFIDYCDRHGAFVGHRGKLGATKGGSGGGDSDKGPGGKGAAGATSGSELTNQETEEVKKVEAELKEQGGGMAQLTEEPEWRIRD